MSRGKERLKRMILLFIQQFSDPYYQGFAAQIAFFIMLSVVPTIVVMSQFLGLLNINHLDFLDTWIDQYITAEMGTEIKKLLSNRASISNNIILIVMAVWAASRAQFALMRIANYTLSGGRTTGNFFKERFRSLRTMIMTILVIAFVIVILVYGKYILQLMMGRLIEDRLIARIWYWFRWPLAMMLYFLIVIYNYHVMPLEKQSLRELLPGSIFGSVGMMIITLFYSAYTSTIVNYNIIYGSLSSIVGLLFWFYFLAWILVLGILVNKVFTDTRGMK